VSQKASEKKPEKMKQCSKCRKSDPESQFSRRGLGLFGICKPCDKNRRICYQNTRDGFINCLIGSSRGSSQRRNRTNAGKHSLTVAQFQEKLAKHQGRCHLSFLPLAFRPYSTWQCSLERVDNSLTYTAENCIPIVLEMNTVAQWTPEKVKHVVDYESTQNSQDELKIETLINEAQMLVIHNMKQTCITRTPQKKVQREFIEGKLIRARCNKCKIWKTAQNFNQATKAGCKTCQAQYKSEYYKSFSGRMKQLVLNARRSSKQRQERGRINMGEFTLTLEQLVQIYIVQKGRCAISKIPMYMYGDAWLVSLERKNPMLNYSKDNCCLICWEFNSGDRTARAQKGIEVTGSCGWTVEKFEEMKRCYKEYTHKLEAEL
jgi:hypothetical protein